jgi:hypothetical protein
MNRPLLSPVGGMLVCAHPIATHGPSGGARSKLVLTDKPCGYGACPTETALLLKSNRRDFAESGTYCRSRLYEECHERRC